VQDGASLASIGSTAGATPATDTCDSIAAAVVARGCTNQVEDPMENLAGVRVAILVDQGFEQVELIEPRKALDAAGAKTTVVSPQKGKVRGCNSKEWADEVPVDLPLEAARPENFDALLLPGGVHNPDSLRMNPAAVAFVKAFFDDNRPVAAICHGPWTIIETGAARGRRMAAWPSLKTDLENAGAEWVNDRVVVDGNLITSRKPDDIPAFNDAINRQFRAGAAQPRKSL
jgi:protease I